MKKPASITLFLLTHQQPVTAQTKRSIHFEWPQPVTEPGNEILAWRVYRSRRSNHYKAVQVGMTLFNSYTDYEPKDGQNYYGIVPVGKKGELEWIDIPLTPEQAALEIKQEKLFNAIDKILWYDWDPLNLKQKDDSETWRYENYAWMIWWLAIEHDDKETIAKELSGIEEGFLKIETNMDACRRVAEKIVNLYA